MLTLPLVETFRRTLPKARLAIVEGLSTHLMEWIATGRVDLGLVLNPEPNPAIEVTPVRDEPLGLVGPVQGLPGYWCACAVMAGFSQGGGVGLALSQWMVNGDPGFDVPER